MRPGGIDALCTRHGLTNAAGLEVVTRCTAGSHPYRRSGGGPQTSKGEAMAWNSHRAGVPREARLGTNFVRDKVEDRLDDILYPHRQFHPLDDELRPSSTP